MGLFDRIFGTKKTVESIKGDEAKELSNLIDNVAELDLPLDQIVMITEHNILDTNSAEAIQKFKHNLACLIKEAKGNGKVDKFMLIRNDDYLPEDWTWKVSSKNTQLEYNGLALCTELKKQYVAEKNNLVTKINGFELPINEERLNEALSKTDKTLALVKLPAKFRSTKHFTINTPLKVTGNYNSVETNRTFTIIDSIDSFISSGYDYSISYHDAYLDVSHESLPISSNAFVLIEKSKYEQIKENSKIMQQLQKRRVIVYTGEEYLAINMVLSELGVLPSQVGSIYADYDEKIKKIINESLESLANNHRLLFDKSHFSRQADQGHFSSHFDDFNSDYTESLQFFVEFLKAKFPNQAHLFSKKSISNSYYSDEIIQAVGTEVLLKAIEEFNLLAENKFQERNIAYKKDRENITPDISNIFKTTVKRINMFYENMEYNLCPELMPLIEEAIRHFFQEDTVELQIKAAKILWNLFEQVTKLSDIAATIITNSSIDQSTIHKI